MLKWIAGLLIDKLLNRIIGFVSEYLRAKKIKDDMAKEKEQRDAEQSKALEEFEKVNKDPKATLEERKKAYEKYINGSN